MNTTELDNLTITLPYFNSTENCTIGVSSSGCNWNLPTLEWIKLIVIFLGGVINALTVIVIIGNKSLHNVTYATIAQIAFADCMYCFSAVVWLLVIVSNVDLGKDFHTYVQCVDDVSYYFVRYILSNVMGSAYFISGFSVASLSIFRYIIIVHPFKSQQLLKRHVIAITFVSLWIIGVLFETWKTYNINSNGAIRIVSECGISYALPSIVMIVFHTLKIINLKQNQFRKDDQQIKKMEQIVVAAVLAFLLLPLSYQIFRFLYFTEIYKAEYLAFTISGWLLQLNSCINPILYALLSPRVRQLILKILCPVRHCVFRNKNNSFSKSTRAPVTRSTILDTSNTIYDN